MENKYRHERKYLIEQKDLNQFFIELYSQNFIEIFSPRFINNIYYDSIDLSALRENIEGISKRTKARVRWYNEDLEHSIFELKIKNSDTNIKKQIKCNLKNTNNYSLGHVLNENSKFLTQNKLENFVPVIKNRYFRKYFLSPCKKFRITIDSKVSSTSLLSSITYNENKIIIEIKHKTSELFSHNFSNLTLNRYSKYSKGMLSTLNFINQY